MIEKLSTEQLIDVLPENLILVRDSGLWSICEHEISNELYCQTLFESFHDFLLRVITIIRKKDYNESLELDIYIAVANSNTKKIYNYDITI